MAEYTHTVKFHCMYALHLLYPFFCWRTFRLFPSLSYCEQCSDEHEKQILSSLAKVRRRQWHPTPVLLPGKSHGWRSLVGCSPWVANSQTRLSDITFTFHFHALEKEMATHSSILAWRIPGTGEPVGLPSMESNRVRHDWSDLAAAAAKVNWLEIFAQGLCSLSHNRPCSEAFLLINPKHCCNKTPYSPIYLFRSTSFLSPWK